MSEQVLGRDFDEDRAERLARPRTFKMGGEIFTIKTAMRPETFADYTEDYYRVTFDPKVRGREVVKVFDETIERFLDSADDSPERWRALRERHNDKPESGEEADVTSGDMHEILMWVFELQTNRRPTRAPSSSGNGRETTGRRSTERSSSGVVVSEA